MSINPQIYSNPIHLSSYSPDQHAPYGQEAPPGSGDSLDPIADAKEYRAAVTARSVSKTNFLATEGCLAARPAATATGKILNSTGTTSHASYTGVSNQGRQPIHADANRDSSQGSCDVGNTKASASEGSTNIPLRH